ncbi:MAG: hypothetical protein KKB21_01570 [Nanoarchaeota archaeon]|nr:hypothetical protein [Nanoarchaeota archaeon]MBU4086245.1 hypothetical protein [Nanoarchaeota archaeon]
MEDTNIGSLVDKRNGDTLEEHVTVLRRIVERAEMPAFITGYCTAEDEIYLQVTDFIQHQLKIPSQAVREIELQRNMRNLSDYFREHKAELQACPADVLLVRARYFERVLYGVLKGGQGRMAHDFDQDIGENQNKRRHAGLDKKIIVVSQISCSEGKEMYDIALSSACASQFKGFIYRF